MKARNPMRPLILLSFDVEEFDIALEYRQSVSVDEQLHVGRTGFIRVLELIDECSAELGTRLIATMFTTARLAEACPTLIARAVEQGHEFASHGYTHEPELKPGDLERSRAVLQAMTGQAIDGFRRPRFAKTDPALIARAGYRYNSSEQPTYMPGRYNNLTKPRRLYRVATAAGPLVQVPVSVAPLCRAPLSWLAFKNFPYPLVQALSLATLRHDGACNFLWHPWEFTDLSRYALPRVVRGIDGERLCRRLSRFIGALSRNGRFATFSEHIAQHARPQVREIS
jgi:peptidoglycan/xylan/chitin deacetylase (PgdA/CDA1 family)